MSTLHTVKMLSPKTFIVSHSFLKLWYVYGCDGCMKYGSVFCEIWLPMTPQGHATPSLEKRARSPLSGEGTGAHYLTFPQWWSRPHAIAVLRVALSRLLLGKLSILPGHFFYWSSITEYMIGMYTLTESLNQTLCYYKKKTFC